MPPVTVTALTPAAAFGSVLLGILISLVLPVAVRTLKGSSGQGLESRTRERKPSLGEKIWNAFVAYGGPKYFKVFGAAVVIALVILLLTGLEFYRVRDAAFAGFAWESLVNKLYNQARGGNVASGPPAPKAALPGASETGERTAPPPA